MAHPEADAVHDPHEAHETHMLVGFYWMIAAILGVITAMEVAIFYIPAIGKALVPSLLILSGAKFVLVVMFFMHLKFDSKVFTVLFLAGLSIAIFMVSSLVVLYYYLPRFRT
ncbi:MAG: cytochrome C oxidase subunit IV [Gemmatimonadetes bacterium]|nr:cytochrome C oxidase subunit IV [Gemmatimonadota bacterium]